MIIGGAQNGVAQNDRIQNYLTLDTTFSFPLKNKFFRDDICLSINNDELWVYFPGQRDDTLDFVMIDLNNFNQNKLSCVFPTMYLKVDSPISSDLSVSQNFICLALDGGQKIVVIERKRHQLNLQQIIPFARERVDLHHLFGDYLFFAKNYNYHPNDSKTKTSIGKYNLKTGYLENIIHPTFDAIEFSHFKPNNWIDFHGGLSLFSQTVRQEFIIYDPLLNAIQSITNGRPSEWNKYSPLKFAEILEGVTPGKSVIYALEKMADTLCRVEDVRFLDNSTFIVINKPNGKVEGQTYRTVDVWKRTTGGQFILFKKDIMDFGFNKADLVTKSNYPIQLQYYSNTWGSGKLVQWRFDAKIDMLNKTLAASQNEAEQFYMDMSNQEVYFLKIFSIHDL